MNLVSNAIRYTDRGGVLVGCRRRSSELRIEVSDSGIGIPEDQRGNIFGEFYQLAASERDRRGASGSARDRRPAMPSARSSARARLDARQRLAFRGLPAQGRCGA